MPEHAGNRHEDKLVGGTKASPGSSAPAGRPNRFWSWAAGLLRPLMLVAASVVFVAIVSFLAPRRAWIEAVSESFLPYGAIPLVVGFAARRSRVATVALLGAAATVSIVTVFYLVRPVLDRPYPVAWSDLFYWSTIGAPSGALLATFAWWLRRRIATTATRFALGAWAFFVAAQVVVFFYAGWGRMEVVTDSGSVTIGQGTADVILASLVLAAFHLGLVLAARNEPSATNGPAGAGTAAAANLAIKAEVTSQ